MKKYILVIILSSLFASGFYGSLAGFSFSRYFIADPKTELSKLEQFYTQHSYIYLELLYRLFPDSTSRQPHSIEKGVFIKKDEAQYSQLGPVESLTTKKYNVSMDHDDKIIMISNLIHIPSNSPIKDFIPGNVKGTTISVQAISASRSAVIIQSDHGEVEETKIEYDPFTHQILKLIIQYRRKIQLSTDGYEDPVAPRLEVEYTLTSFEERQPDKTDISNYVIGSGSHWRPNSKYYNYDLIDNIQPIPQIKE